VDVAAKASHAAVVAYRLALEGIIASTSDEARKTELRAINVAHPFRELAQ
jgi:hypothetical protein